MHRQGMVSIWFFIGALLLIYGILITGAGIYELSNPPAHPVVHAELHAGIWWGASPADSGNLLFGEIPSRPELVPSRAVPVFT